MSANASVHTCILAQPEFNMRAFENLNSEFHFQHCLFFHIGTGSASERAQSGTLNETEKISFSSVTNGGECQ